MVDEGEKVKKETEMVETEINGKRFAVHWQCHLQMGEFDSWCDYESS